MTRRPPPGKGVRNADRSDPAWASQLYHPGPPIGFANEMHSQTNTQSIVLDPADFEWSAIRAQGAGGQNVNKVSSAVHLRFDIRASHLSEAVKARLLAYGDQRISSDGIIVIKAQRHRSQDRNRDDAVGRLRQLIDAATAIPRPRTPTKPTRSSQRRRVDAKVARGRVKSTRGRVDE